MNLLVHVESAAIPFIPQYKSTVHLLWWCPTTCYTCEDLEEVDADAAQYLLNTKTQGLLSKQATKIKNQKARIKVQKTGKTWAGDSKILKE